ncbi:MAG: DUF3524 domain-containing protein [Gammaproteobacteria bacterium]|nr:DUF3524 domain-containing protein [Gammaproteobacteria bacterium]
MAPRILLLSSYHAQSHEYWANTITHHIQDVEWTQLTLPARFFSWRTRGNSLTWGLGDYPQLAAEYDLIIATSMVDISALRGFRPNLATVPLIVYFHENQFAYPWSKHQVMDINIPLTSIYSAACADQVLFNSEYNRQSFFTGAKQLLDKMPDGIPANLIANIRRNSSVLPVPLDLPITPTLTLAPKTPLKVVWNHRWEYDKNPEAMLAVFEALARSNLPFSGAIVGQSFRDSPKCFKQITPRLRACLKHFGYLSASDYRSCLNDSTIVLSTAWHDFQGLAMQMAMAHGCIPIAPNRVAYSEYIPSSLLYSVADNGSKAAAIAEESEQILNKFEYLYHNGFAEQTNSVSDYHQSQLIPPYRALIASLVKSYKATT